MYTLLYTVLALNIYSVNCIGILGIDLRFEYTRRFYGRPVNDTSDPKWIEQPIDHFDESDTRTWKLRYFENLDHWQQSGPIYLYINGEDTAYPSFSGLVMTELAQETNGAMFVAEHRYYGSSQPFADVTVENLAYLSSRQALADIAHLLETIKSDPKFKSSKVVAVGGSYAGNLAAWIRLLYPTVVDAAISSSAPVLAKKDFYEYLETVNDVFQKYGSSDCIEKIKKRFSRYEELLQSASGIEKLKDEENICAYSDMSKAENQQLFFLTKTGDFMSTAQYGTIDSIKDTCNSNKFSTFSNDLSLFHKRFWISDLKCYAYDFDSFVDSMKSEKGYYSWVYQTCTEFGYFQSTSSNKQPFTKNIPVDLFYKICVKLFGSQFNEQRVEDGVNKTNQLYGGLRPNVTNVVFVNGELDPWHRLGVLEDISDDAPAMFIPGASHCADMLTNNPNDSQILKEARQNVKNYIKKWIGVNK